MTINYLAVVVAAAANFIIGFLMHGPVAGKLWMKLAKIVPTGNEKLSDMIPQMVKNFLSNLVFAYFLALIYSWTVSSLGGSVMAGVTLAVAVWFGFLVTSSSIEVIWMGRSYKLWLFEAFSSLISVVAMGVIIALWQ